MQFFIYFAWEEGKAMTPPSPEGMAEVMAMMQEGMASGVIVSTGQLSSTTTHVRLSGGEISVTDGPFMEGKELIPGYTIIEVDSKQEAVEWTKRLRRAMGEGTLRMAQVSV